MYIFQSYNILHFFSHLLCYFEHVCSSFIQLKRFTGVFPVSIVSNCHHSFASLVFSLYCFVCFLGSFTLPPLEYQLLFLDCYSSWTSSFHHCSLSPLCCLSTDFSCGTQQCIWQTSMINICSFYSITYIFFLIGSLSFQAIILFFPLLQTLFFFPLMNHCLSPQHCAESSITLSFLEFLILNFLCLLHNT